MLVPSQVFTLQIPVRATNVYARRGLAEAQLDKLLQRGQVPLIFGEYGVGKTSMARVWSKAAESAGKLVNIESLQGKTLADIQARILEVLGYRVTRSVERAASASETKTVSAGFSGGPASLPITLSGTKETASESGRTETDELVVTSPTDSKVLDLAEGAGLVLLLDELHQASAEFREHLTGFLKSYANKSCQRFRIILLGTASDATSLVRADPGIDRLIQEVHLGAMTEQETEHLVREGMSALAINVEAAIVHKIARTSAGSPTIAQYLALEVAEAAFGRDPRRVFPSDLKSAIDSFVALKAKRLNAVYVSAVETTGPRKYRKQVLRAIAESEDEYVDCCEGPTRSPDWINPAGAGRDPQSRQLLPQVAPRPPLPSNRRSGERSSRRRRRMIPLMLGFRPALPLAFLLAGCASPEGTGSATPERGVLAFTDANVVSVSGGYADPAVPVAPDADVCFDTSGVGWPVGTVEIWRVGMGEAGLRCALGLDGLTQVNFLGGLYTDSPGAERTCLSDMDLVGAEPLLSCQSNAAWAVLVRAVDDSARAYRILDPCAGGGATEVVIDGTEPSFTDVVADVQAATPLSVEVGVRYILDWSPLSLDVFGAPVDPADLYGVVVADVTGGAQLSEAVLAPGENADAFYELRGHPGETTLDLAEDASGGGFPGFEAGHRYLVGFSPPSDCIEASVVATVEVVE